MTGLEFVMAMAVCATLTIAMLTLPTPALMIVWLICFPFGVYVLTRVASRFFSGEPFGDHD